MDRQRLDQSKEVIEYASSKQIEKFDQIPTLKVVVFKNSAFDTANPGLLQVLVGGMISFDWKIGTGQTGVDGVDVIGLGMVPGAKLDCPCNIKHSIFHLKQH